MPSNIRTLNVYQAKDGFRWNLWYAGKIIAESGQAYKRRPTAERAGRSVLAGDYPVRLTIQRYVRNRLVSTSSSASDDRSLQSAAARACHKRAIHPDALSQPDGSACPAPHHFDADFNRFHSAVGRRMSNYVTAANALARRGLFRDHEVGPPCHRCESQYCAHKLSRAGDLVSELLEESGIYEDIVSKWGLTKKSAA